MKNSSLTTSSTITFRNSQGSEAQGTLMRLNRHSVVFEVYNPYSIVQLSEVLNDMRIRRGERDIYTGKAVVTNLVSTGLMLIVSASLVDPWSDLVGLAPGPQLREEVENFVEDWVSSNARVHTTFKDAITDMRNFLESLSSWLEHGETVVGITEPDVSPDLCNEFVSDVESMVGSRMSEVFGRFEAETHNIAREEIGIHKAYAQRELHPVVLCSPFIYRTYTKPLGYAGDYEMVNMMLRDPWEGRNTFAKLVNASALQTDAVIGHRNRIDMLTNSLVSEARRANDLGRNLRVLNVGCGPAIEVQRFIESTWLADRIEITLLDFNEETLRYTETQIRDGIQRHQRQTMVNFQQRSVNSLLKEASARDASDDPTFDFIYCAGLFDYFGDAICGFLLNLYYKWIVPDGLVLATNVAPGHSREGIMKYLQEWNLRVRDKQALLELAPELGHQKASIDATGANAFLEIRKPNEQEMAK